jgi:hypothetical protein
MDSGLVGTGEHNAEGADRIREYELLVLLEEIEFLNGCSSLLCVHLSVDGEREKLQHF